MATSFANTQIITSGLTFLYDGAKPLYEISQPLTGLTPTSPILYNDIYLWLDATSGVSYYHNNVVSSWSDVRNNGIVFTSVTSAYSPTVVYDTSISANTLFFDSYTSQTKVLSATTILNYSADTKSNNITLYLVYKLFSAHTTNLPTVQGRMSIINLNGQPSQGIWRYVGNVKGSIGNTFNNARLDDVHGDTRFHIIGLNRFDNLSYFYKDGLLRFSSYFYTGGPIFPCTNNIGIINAIGGNNLNNNPAISYSMWGYISEILIFKRSLKPEEHYGLMNYFKLKYNTSVTPSSSNIKLTRNNLKYYNVFEDYFELQNGAFINNEGIFLDGVNDSVNVLTNGKFKSSGLGNTNYTFSVWFKRTTTSNQRGPDITSSLGALYITNTGLLQYVQSGYVSGLRQFVTNQPSFPINKYHNVVVRIRSGTITQDTVDFFINGVKYSVNNGNMTSNIVNGNPTTRSALNIGQTIVSFRPCIIGKMTEYNRILSDDEVLFNYKSELNRFN